MEFLREVGNQWIVSLVKKMNTVGHLLRIEIGVVETRILLSIVQLQNLLQNIP